MRRRLGACLVAVLASTSCGGVDEPEDESSANGGSAGSGASGGAGAVAGSSGSGGSGGVATGGTGSGGTPIVPDVVTIEMGPFEVAPGRDTYRCQNFENPFGGVDVEIAEFESHMTEGSHHLILNYNDAKPSGIEPCSGLEPPRGPYTTQARDDRLTYPEGIAAPLAGNQGLRINSHYVNPENTPYQARIAITLRRAQPGTVRAQAHSSFGLAFDIYVPPGQTGYASSSVSFTQDVRLLWLLPHMHWHGTRFTVTTGGQQIFETNDWETPPHPFEPVISVPAGQSLLYECEYYNGGTVPLSFGESAATDEMCVLVVQYYNARDL